MLRFRMQLFMRARMYARVYTCTRARARTYIKYNILYEYI